MVADGAHPPIDKACGEGLLPDTLAALRELGVAVNGPEGHAVLGVRFLGRESEAAASFPAGNGIGIPGRSLHQRLVERADDCGVSFLGTPRLWESATRACGWRPESCPQNGLSERMALARA